MKIFIGRVTSNKMPKTATVLVERFVADPIYKKRLKRAKKYLVQDELGAKVGDRVNFVASKPFSKLKRWKITKIVDKPKSQLKTERKKR